MTTVTTQDRLAVQTHRIFVKATAEEVWDALTRPGWTQKYGFRAAVHYHMRPGGIYLVFASAPMRMRGAQDVIIDGEVIAADPPHRLVQTWHVLFDEQAAAEADTRLTWEIEEGDAGVTALTVCHELDGAPRTADLVAGRDTALGGWTWILSDLKSLLETGRPLAA
jgi:uncharacterized protein YndB with AHSA1/START domain